MTRKPYDKRTDLEKCQSQWWKLTGLKDREESSAAIVRAATAAEIACNYAIRTEIHGKLRAEVVDRLLRDANGIKGKIDRLLIPLVKGTKKEAAISRLKLKALADEINNDRNAIVHRGEFRKKTAATKTIETARRFVQGLVRLYAPHFTLKDQTESPTSED
jgi:hypothetical protein